LPTSSSSTSKQDKQVATFAKGTIKALPSPEVSDDERRIGRQQDGKGKEEGEGTEGQRDVGDI
jgi:hypothetical protein